MGDWEYYWRGMRIAWEWTFPEKYPGLLGLVYDWQTLISGLLAFGAGTLVYGQTRLQKKQFDEERNKYLDARRRQERAARMRIPHALAELSTFVEEGYAMWVKNHLLGHRLDQLPIDTLKQISEAIDDESYVSVRELVNALQVFQSRHLQPGGSFLPGQAGLDLAKLEYLINRLYEFGRVRDDNPIPFIEPTKPEIVRLLESQRLLLKQRTHDHDRIDTLIDQAIKIAPSK